MQPEDSFGQTIGYKEGPDITFSKYNASPNLGYTYGFFYDSRVREKFGFSTGLQYSIFKFGSFFVFSQENYSPTYSSATGGILLKVIEVPLDIDFKLSGKDSSEYQLFFTGGYSFCYILKKMLIQEGIVVNKNNDDALNSVFSNNVLNYARLGLELRLFPYERINFSLGLQYKCIFAGNRFYGEVNNWIVYIKTGVNLSKFNHRLFL